MNDLIPLDYALLIPLPSLIVHLDRSIGQYP